MDNHNTLPSSLIGHFPVRCTDKAFYKHLYKWPTRRLSSRPFWYSKPERGFIERLETYADEARDYHTRIIEDFRTECDKCLSPSQCLGGHAIDRVGGPFRWTVQDFIEYCVSKKIPLADHVGQYTDGAFCVGKQRHFSKCLPGRECLMRMLKCPVKPLLTDINRLRAMIWLSGPKRPRLRNKEEVEEKKRQQRLSAISKRILEQLENDESDNDITDSEEEEEEEDDTDSGPITDATACIKGPASPTRSAAALLVPLLVDGRVMMVTPEYANAIQTRCWVTNCARYTRNMAGHYVVAR